MDEASAVREAADAVAVDFFMNWRRETEGDGSIMDGIWLKFDRFVNGIYRRHLGLASELPNKYGYRRNPQ